MSIPKSLPMRPMVVAVTALLAGCVTDGTYYEPATAYPSYYSSYPAYGTGSVYYVGRDSPWERCRARYSERYCHEYFGRGRDRDDDDDRRRRANRRDRDHDDDNDRDRERRRNAERQAEAERAARREQARQEERQRAQAGEERRHRERGSLGHDLFPNTRQGDLMRSEHKRLSGQGE